MDLLIKTLKTYSKYKPVRDELSSLTGKKKSKFYEEHQDELTKLREASNKLKEWFPNGNVPTLEMVEKKRQTFVDERAKKDEEYKTVKAEAEQLGKAMQTVENYLSRILISAPRRLRIHRCDLEQEIALQKERRLRVRSGTSGGVCIFCRKQEQNILLTEKKKCKYYDCQNESLTPL